MIPNQNLTPYPEFGNNSTKVKPDDPKYSAGFQPADVLPAEWLNWFLSRASKGVTELGEGVSSMEQEINNVLTAGGETPDQEQTSQLLTAINALITAVQKVEQQLPPIGVPTLWFTAKPDWALDFGNGATTKYLWANYPGLNNTRFKDMLTFLQTHGHMGTRAWDTSGFYVPDLRGLVPVCNGVNAIRTDEFVTGGAFGDYWESRNKYHNHGFAGTALWGKFGKVGSSTRNISTCFFNNDDGSYNQGGFSLFSEICARYLEPGGESSSTSYMNRSMGWTFSYTPAGTIGYNGVYSDNKAYNGKPSTIALMWIIRFE